MFAEAAAYAVAKSTQNALMCNLALAYAKEGIRINAVEPGDQSSNQSIHHLFFSVTGQ